MKKRLRVLTKKPVLFSFVILIILGVSCGGPEIEPIPRTLPTTTPVINAFPRPVSTPTFVLQPASTKVPLQPTPTKVPLPGTRFPEQSRDHTFPQQPRPPYSTTPATSGLHYGAPLAPLRWGVHLEPLLPEEYVHNLEHGGIGIFYDCPDGCDETVDQLSAIVNSGERSGLKMFLAPHSDTNALISLTAWTFMEQLDEYDEDRIVAFVNAHESSVNSPEPFAR